MKKMIDLNLQDNLKDEIRLQVYLAHSGIASRRASESIILSGRVSINGAVVTKLGTKVKKEDRVCLDGKPIELENEKKICFIK